MNTGNLSAMTMTEKTKYTLRAIAIFEGSKGVLVIAAGCTLLSWVHQDVQAAAEQFVRHLHFNPARHYPKIFSMLALDMTDGTIRLLALYALLYSLLRCVEAYGLWFGRHWAEWVALLGGGIWLPLELYELARGVTWIKAGITVINIIVVFSMASVIRRNWHEKHRVTEASQI